jgi:LysM repeat protein
MTDRGLPIVDGAPACPFVAFEDDRDARATSPDHRHRCYAEVRPAPRALAHQEAYCLSSAFPVCPTFQDWARREAAQAKASSSAASAADAGGAAAIAARAPRDREDDYDDYDERVARDAPPGVDGIGRNPPRNWSAPPPWMNARDDEEEEPPDVVAQPPVRGSGLAGSFADRLAGGSPNRAAPPVSHPGDDGMLEGDRDDAGRDGARSEPAASATLPGLDRRSARDDRRAAPPALPGPSWERPRRMEAYPTLKTRMGLPSISFPPILVAVLALVLAATAIFFLPTLLGVGNPPQTGSSPSPTANGSAAASETPASPTPVPGPTQQVYLVQPGDTMSRIANRFGVPLQALIDANKETIPNPDLLEIGQEVIIPATAPTSLPDAGASPSAAP